MDYTNIMTIILYLKCMTLVSSSFPLICSHHCWFQVDIFSLHNMYFQWLCFQEWVFIQYEIPFLFLGKYFPNTYCNLDRFQKYTFSQTLSTN